MERYSDRDAQMQHDRSQSRGNCTEQRAWGMQRSVPGMFKRHSARKPTPNRRGAPALPLAPSQPARR